MSVTLTPESSIFAFQRLPSDVVELGDRALNPLLPSETALLASQQFSCQIIPTQLSISTGGFDLKNPIADFQNRYIKSAATQVKHQDGLASRRSNP